MKVNLLLALIGLATGLAVARASAAEPTAESDQVAPQPSISNPTNAPVAAPEQFQVRDSAPAPTLAEALVNRLARELTPETVEPVQRPNEISVGSYRYSGILVQVLRSANPLQLLNPWAPASAGAGAQNLVLDPVSGGPSGLKLLAVNF